MKSYNLKWWQNEKDLKSKFLFLSRFPLFRRTPFSSKPPFGELFHFRADPLFSTESLFGANPPFLNSCPFGADPPLSDMCLFSLPLVLISTKEQIPSFWAFLCGTNRLFLSRSLLWNSFSHWVAHNFCRCKIT